jgi:hypothetical protein
MVTVWCPNCSEQFSEGVTHCPDCGVETMTAEAVPAEGEATQSPVPEGYALLEANWVGPPGEFVEWLDDEGIPVLTMPYGDGAGSRLYVPEADLTRAEELLQEFHEDDYEEVEIEFDENDLSVRSRELLAEGDLDSFAMLDDGPEEVMLDLADRLEEAGIPVLVVDVDEDEDLCEVHVPDRHRVQAEQMAGVEPEPEGSEVEVEAD